MNVGFLFNWYNLPFTVALACCLVFAVLQMFGGSGDSDADVDTDVDAGVDADVDVDVDVDTHNNTPAAVQSGGALALLGIGRAPLMLVLMAFTGGFGVVGLLANALLAGDAATYPDVAFVPVLLIGVLLGALVTNRFSRVFARVAPNVTIAIGYEQLVGRVGTVVSSTISPTYGRVQVRDSHGSLHTVFAVVERGEPIPAPSEVALVAYDAAQRRFVVRLLR